MDESLSSPNRPGAPAAAFAWCAAELRRYDPDRYFASLFAGAEGRRALFALYAFNLEIAKIRESVSQPILGQIRLQWWREAIDGIWQGTPRDHTVVAALAEAVQRSGPTRARFDRLIDAREFDLAEHGPATLDALVAYADESAGELACLALELLGAHDEAALAAGRAGGTAWALAGLLRAVPFHAAQGSIFLPRDLMAAHGAAPADLLAGRRSEGLDPTVAAVAQAARGRLAEARAGRAAIPRIARPAVAHLGLVEADLRRLERAGYDVFALKPPLPFARQCRILIAALTGRW